jgi:cob(I)alamin adenosyltransferase
VSKTSLYTKYGDGGYTFTKGSPRTPKNNIVIKVVGELDELNSHIGFCISLCKNHLGCQPKFLQETTEFLAKIQSALFQIGAFYGYKSELLNKNLDLYIQKLEKQTDEQEKENSELHNFVLPCGSPPAAYAHICRSVTRRVERVVCDYNFSLKTDEEKMKLIQVFLNRLSDYFFSLSRTLNRVQGVNELLWSAESLEYNF